MSRSPPVPARTAPDGIQIPDGELRYDASLLGKNAADLLLDSLLALPDWEQLQLRMFGRRVSAPRLTAWYGDPGATYAYSGITHEPLPWPKPLASLRERLCEAIGLDFNSVLGNHYRDGNDGMGWHSDDEPELGDDPVIASLSLGATRRFQLRHRTRRDLETQSLALSHGSLLVMSGPTQHHWKHALPKTRTCHDVRINLTFRRLTLR